MPSLTESVEDDRISWPCPPTSLPIESLESSKQTDCGDKPTQETAALSSGFNSNIDGNPRISPSQESLSVIATQLLSPVLESEEKKTDSDCDARTALKLELKQPSLLSEPIFQQQPSKENIKVDMTHDGPPQVVSEPPRPLPSSRKVISPMEQEVDASEQQSPQLPLTFDHSDTPELNDTSMSTPSNTAAPVASLFNSVKDATKVVIVGDGTVGKACMAYMYTTGIWLTAGQEDYDRLRPLSYPGTDVFLVCFAINSPVSFSNITEKWIPEIQRFCPHSPFILVGLKTDLRNDAETMLRLKKQREKHITREMGAELAKKINALSYVECSSLNRTGVEDVFIETVLDRQQLPLLSEPVLFSEQRNKEEIPVDVVGDALIGKTCLAYTYATGRFPKFPPPYMKVLANVQLGRNSYTTNIRVHDCFPIQHLPMKRVFLLCFSVAWPNSIRIVFEKFVPELKLRHPQAPVIVVGLQTDLRDDRETHLRLENLQQKPFTKKNGKEIARKIGAVKYVECSALTRAGLTKVFEQAVKAVVLPHDLRRKHKCSQM